jgi:hypothetical protein
VSECECECVCVSECVSVCCVCVSVSVSVCVVCVCACVCARACIHVCEQPRIRVADRAPCNDPHSTLGQRKHAIVVTNVN